MNDDDVPAVAKMQTGADNSQESGELLHLFFSHSFFNNMLLFQTGDKEDEEANASKDTTTDEGQCVRCLSHHPLRGHSVHFFLCHILR